MASTFLTRSKSSPTSDKKGTISFWIKRTNLTDQQMTLVSGGGSIDSNIFFENDGTLQVYDYQSGAYQFRYVTNRVFKDISAWYHVVIRIDTTDATAGDRVKIYVNGVQETSFSVETDPSVNLTPLFFTNAYAFWIGAYRGSSGYTDGLYTHFHYTDGYIYDASDFGESDSVSGIWKPKTSPSVTYGTNGFFLKFENSGAMGTDSSGNSNTFTVSGTLTQNVDTPSNNFATMNPLTKGVSASAYPTFANGNTTITNTVRQHGFSSLGVSSGKWYTEFKITSGATSSVTGISDGSYTTYLGHGTGDYSYRGSDGTWYNNQSATSYGSALSDNDIVGVALDLDNNKLYFSINGTFQNSGDPTSGATGTGAISISAPATGFYHFATGNILTSGTITAQSNFGQGYFGTTAVASANADDGGLGAMEYDVPANYRILCTKNIKDYG